jgi:primosomal protein N' (replication factor Y)
MLHSAMNEKQRYAAWHAAANNQARIIIGTRSSIFTPIPELGLIIIDEEHDGSYKQQDGFRYNARDLAILRARNKNIPIVLGSATPSLESLNNINEQRYEQHFLKQRANKKPLPKVELVNLCNQKLHEGMAETLLDRIKQHLDQDGQILLFINRRGFAPLLMCHECGWTTNCQRCDAHMTFHKRRNQLHCHHCGSQRPAPQQCEECGSSNVVAIGSGTERIEQFLQNQFPDTHVNRIDRDTTRNKGSLQEKLEKARSGESGILVGTQMLAKGHDFPNITLVCVLDTDQALFSADFRAAEHLAQLITQVSGRAGRAEKSGEVLIQTHHPDHPLLQTLLHKGYQSFADAALSERRAAGLPPIHHLVLLRCESVEVEAAQRFLTQALELAKQYAIEGLELFGPIPAPMERRAGRFRYQLMLQSKQRKHLHQLLSVLPPQLQQLQSARKVRWSIDVDPYDTF